MFWRPLRCFLLLSMALGFNLHTLAVEIRPLNSDLIFFDPKKATGSNVLMAQTTQYALKPVYLYDRLLDGTKGNNDINYFWAVSDKVCLHIYFKELILLESIVVYIHARQMSNVKTIGGLMTDGLSNNISRNLSVAKTSYTHIHLYPDCKQISTLAVTDRFRLCFDLKKKGFWFGINELEIFGNPNIKAEPNIAKYRTLQSAMSGCSAYGAVAAPKTNVDQMEPLKNWTITFEQSYVIKSISAFVAVEAGRSIESLAEWLRVRLGNGSTLVIPDDKCTWSLAPAKVAALGSALLQWKEVKCKVEFPPAAGLLLQDNLRISDLRVSGSPYRYPEPTLIRTTTKDFFSTTLLCQLKNCQSHKLAMYDESVGFVDVVVDGQVVPGTPLVADAMNVTTTPGRLWATMPLDYNHAGRYRCSCVWADDNALLKSQVVDVDVDPKLMPADLIRSTVLSDFIFDYKFSWNSTVPFKSTPSSYILFRPKKHTYLSTRMRVFSFRNGKTNSSIMFEKGVPVQPRQVSVCRTPQKRFCVPGFEFLQPVQFHRIQDLKAITVRVWLGFIEEWKNYTIHLHRKGQFDFWPIEQDDDRLVIDIYCPKGVSCSGNLTQISMTCGNRSEVRTIPKISAGHSDVLEIEDINPMAAYILCLQRDDQERCMRKKKGQCSKCVEIKADQPKEGSYLSRILKLSARVISYSSFDEERLPQRATVRISFGYDANFLSILRCANVGVKQLNIYCEGGYTKVRTWNDIRLRTIVESDLPLDVVCSFDVSLYTNASEKLIPMTATLDIRRSPFTKLEVTEWTNATHARLEWYADPTRFPYGYLKNYRVVATRTQCNGKNRTTEIEQADKTSYIFPLNPTSIYTVTVIRIIQFNGSLQYVRSLPFTFEAKPPVLEAPTLTDVMPIDRNSAEAFVNFKQYSRCFAVRGEAAMGQTIAPAQVQLAGDKHRLIVNTSSLTPLSVTPMKVRAQFGSVVTPWSSKLAYQVPIDTVISSPTSGKVGSNELQMKAGSSKTLNCNCGENCPPNVSFVWRRGWLGGEIAGNGRTLVLSKVRPKDSGRYVCLYRLTSGSSGKSQSDSESSTKVAASVLVIVQQTGASNLTISESPISTKAVIVEKGVSDSGNDGISIKEAASSLAVSVCIFLQAVQFLVGW